MSECPCPHLPGPPPAQGVSGGHRGGIDIDAFTHKSVDDALEFVDQLTLTETQMRIAQRILKEIRERLGFLRSVGLQYLTLSRSAASLSGGESQRIRLATQIGSSLMGVLYILDEPFHRPAPAGQRHAAGDHEAPAGPGQHPAGGGAR